MYRIARYFNLSENFSVDQEVMVRTKNGWVDGVVKRINGKSVSWSNSQGQMGTNNIEDVRPVEVKDLRDRYFKSNSKYSKFYVPFEEIKSSDKALFLGYNGKGIWVPKKLIDGVWPKKFDYPNTPTTGYQISLLVYFDEDKQKFFDDYAKYIHEQVSSKKKDQYQKYLVNNKQLLSDVTKVVKHVYKQIGSDIIEPQIDWINYETNTFDIDGLWQIRCDNGSIRAIKAVLDDKTFDLSPDNVKNDTLERRMFYAAISKKLKTETAEHFKKVLETELKQLESSKDDYADYSDDHRTWKAEQLRKDLANKIEKFLDYLSKLA